MKNPVIEGVEINTHEDIMKALSNFCSGDKDILNNACVFDDYAPACVGFTSNNQIVYSYDRMVEFIITRDNVSQKEAEKHVDDGAVKALYSLPNPPIILYPPENYTGKLVDSAKDQYKVKVIQENLDQMVEDEYYLVRLRGDAGKAINIDAPALLLLQAYYSGLINIAKSEEI